MGNCQHQQQHVAAVVAVPGLVWQPPFSSALAGTSLLPRPEARWLSEEPSSIHATASSGQCWPRVAGSSTPTHA